MVKPTFFKKMGIFSRPSSDSISAALGKLGSFPEHASPLNRCLGTVLCAKASVKWGGETDVKVTATSYLSYWTKVVFDRFDLTQLEALLRTSLNESAGGRSIGDMFNSIFTQSRNSTFDKLRIN